VGIVLGYTLFDHVRIRIATWLDPWKYIDNKGYQITQSLFAIASGGFFGTGIGLGHPDFIPAVHTDFIFSAICEEMGVFTGMAIIMLFLILVYRGFKIAFSQDDKFFQIVAFGISILFGFQSFIIFGGVMKLIPLTGITLPFVSYGGSSLLSSFIALGVLQVASEEIEQEEVEDEKRA
jgi:cell division protein FtsW (lipid II flippase)